MTAAFATMAGINVAFRKRVFDNASVWDRLRFDPRRAQSEIADHGSLAAKHKGSIPL
jgi:hypothetical protein